MTDILKSISANLVDVLVYIAIAAVFLVGVFKCAVPVRGIARKLRRGVHMLETMIPAEGERPVWQDTLFLGKKMQLPWRKFLQNAEQLDARGLSCNVEDYINDDTTIYAVGHMQLSEVIPGLLTSLGILGTFVGLMRGLGGLDVSDAAKTMESIPHMIGGMTFAFSTSIVGIACSLLFNIFNRMAQGSATAAIDEFQQVFSDLVMQRPLDEGVQMICQQRDRDVMLRRMSGDVASKLSAGVQEAVERSLVPVTQSMTRFIMGQTQSQMEGVANISQQFVSQMNRILGGQLLKLGETLSAINQSQAVNYDALQRVMASADQVMDNMSHIQTATEGIITRFEGYIRSVESAQQNNDAFLTHGSQVLSGLMSSNEEQSSVLNLIKDQQREMEKDMRDYAAWSSRALSVVKDQEKDASYIGKEMRKSADMLSSSYSSFVQNIGNGLNKTVEMFGNHVRDILKVLEEKMDELEKAAFSDSRGQENLVTEISRLQRVMTDLQTQIEDLNKSMKKAHGEAV